MVDLDQILGALSDPTRRAVVELLGEEPRCSSHIAKALETSRPAMSRHLRVLRKCGLVAERIDEDDARLRVYHLRREPLEQLRSWIDEVEAFWNDQLDSFVAHAQGRRGEP